MGGVFLLFPFREINDFACLTYIVPAWGKFYSTMEKVSFHHDGTKLTPWWNDLRLAVFSFHYGNAVR